MRNSVVGTNFLLKDNSPPTKVELKTKLSLIWGLENFRLVPMGGGHYHIILQTMEYQSIVMAHKPANISSGIFRGAHQQLRFHPRCLKTTTQVWARFHGTALEFRKSQNFKQRSYSQNTIKVQSNNCDLILGLYARVLIDVNTSR